MKWLGWILIGIILASSTLSFPIESTSYQVNSTHLGLSGDKFSSGYYEDGRFTLTHQQSGDDKAQSWSMAMNVGWFDAYFNDLAYLILPVMVGVIFIPFILMLLNKMLKTKNDNVMNFVTAIRLAFFFFVLWVVPILLNLTKLMLESFSVSSNVIDAITSFYTTYIYFAITLTAVIIIFYLYSILMLLRVKEVEE